jgi:protein-tyrosine-phosphatase
MEILLDLDIHFESAGFINAFSYMQPESQKFLNSKRIDYSDFKPQLVSQDLLKRQDLIITMEESHKERITQNYEIENLKDKLFTLKEFAGSSDSNLDISDPYYTSKEEYFRLIEVIDKNVHKMIQKLKKINS